MLQYPLLLTPCGPNLLSLVIHGACMEFTRHVIDHAKCSSTELSAVQLHYNMADAAMPAAVMRK